MKSKVWTVAAAAGLLFATNIAHAQVRQPAPTGQVPKAYSGVQSAPAATFKPKPTGQIAPEAPGQLGTIVQPAPATAPVQKVSEVQDLGFEVNSRPSTQQGMVPKVNTSQDPRTMPERYQSQTVQQQQAATGQVQQVQMQQVPVTGSPATGTYAPGTQVTPSQTTRPATTGPAASQPGQVSTPYPSGAPKAASQRVELK